MDDRQHRSDSFVVRIWWEEGGESPVWRGWVQHAASGETRYFHRVGDLLDFVEGCTGALIKLEIP
ncbi:MAG: hypothetical protein AB8I69_21445 [Anaerolineae bacterium]